MTRRLTLTLLSTLALTSSIAVFAAARTPMTGVRFRDCPKCPEMIVVPSGRFTLMPSLLELAADTSREEVEHQASEVTVESFAVGVYHVTRAEYATFVRETHRSHAGGCQILDGNRWITDIDANWRRPGFRQTDRHPVVCVSWDDAQAYVLWLNGKVRGGSRNGPYRLLTGAEWEYVARGGRHTRSPYYWGFQVSHDDANYGLDQCWPCGLAKRGRDRWYHTSPVGAFSPNVFGLYDMFGNVWQWTNDCHEDGDCRVRTLRGGAYNDMALFLRVASRNPFLAHVRNNANGFRVARTLMDD